MFVTSEHGIQLHDTQPRSAQCDSLIGIQVPHLFFIKKVIRSPQKIKKFPIWERIWRGRGSSWAYDWPPFDCSHYERIRRWFEFLKINLLSQYNDRFSAKGSVKLWLIYLKSHLKWSLSFRSGALRWGHTKSSTRFLLLPNYWSNGRRLQINQVYKEVWLTDWFEGNRLIVASRCGSTWQRWVSKRDDSTWPHFAWDTWD